jgi:dienelactone hydrolase
MARRCALLALTLALVAPAPAAAQFSPESEGRNYSKINERFSQESGTPAYQAMLRERSAQEDVALANIRVTDPERSSTGNLCSSHMDGCAGDVRFYSWQTDGFGIRRPLTFVARNGGVISGHLWYTREGPAVRPAIVITTGSVQAPEELYGFVASTLAKRGYVVLTYDVITQGRSDNRGEGADAGYYQTQSPDQFVDGTVDALDFLLSTPASPYRPRFPARKADGTALQQDHAPKQTRRVAAKLSEPYNPVSALVDPTRVGIVGHSLGAYGVSRVAADDRRVKAVVAYDNLSVGGSSSFGPTEPIPPRVPALGMSNDYGLTPTPYESAPEPAGKNVSSVEFSRRGVDTMQVNTRGGTHYEYSFIPNPGFPATLRGMDMAAWYTAAWLDRYVKGDAGAEARLLTTRWLDDARAKQLDPAGDGNLLSTYFRSRIDFGRAGGRRVTCEDLRAGPARCAALAPDGCAMKAYSYLAEAQTKDGAPPPASVSCASRAAAGGGSPTARFAVRVGLSAPRLASSASRSSTFPVAVVPPGGASAALVDRYQLQVRAGRVWRTLRTGTGAPRVRFRGVDGRVHRFRARAIGRGGVLGPWREAATIVPRDDRLRFARGVLRLAPNPRFAGGWARRGAAGAWRASLTVALRRGATMTFRFTGRRVWLIGRRSPRGGLALAVLDGRARLVSFHGRRVADRRLIATLRARRAGRHTLRVVYLDRHARGSRGTRVAVDALGVS